LKSDLLEILLNECNLVIKRVTPCPPVRHNDKNPGNLGWVKG
jgi:hypothetical protein